MARGVLCSSFPEVPDFFSLPDFITPRGPRQNSSRNWKKQFSWFFPPFLTKIHKNAIIFPQGKLFIINIKTKYIFKAFFKDVPSSEPWNFLLNYFQLSRYLYLLQFKPIYIPRISPRTSRKGWRHFVDNDISWTLFFKMGDFSWTFSKGDFSWTLLVTSRGQF